MFISQMVLGLLPTMEEHLYIDTWFQILKSQNLLPLEIMSI